MPIGLSARTHPVTLRRAIRAAKARMVRAEAAARKRIATVSRERELVALLTGYLSDSQAREVAEVEQARRMANPYKDQSAPAMDSTPAPLPLITG